MSLGLVASLLSAGLVSSAHAAVVKASSWSASSSAPASEGVNYDMANLGDAKASTPWVEGDEGSGLGSWAMADFGAPRTITRISVWAGVWYNQEYWGRYNRPKTLLAEFSDGTSQEFTLTDEFKPQELTLKAPKQTTSVKLKVKAVYAGNTFNDTGISEVVFRDGAPDPFITPKTFAASSTFPADADGNYEGANTADGILDTMWCEGNKKSDGTNEWMEVGFGGVTSVSKLVLRNGNAYSFPYFMKSNRATGATLTFSDGSTAPIVVKDSISEQTITFPAHDTSKVRITFTGVKKGSEFDDLCVSEAYFLP
jgi:hypothetical protein